MKKDIKKAQRGLLIPPRNWKQDKMYNDYMNTTKGESFNFSTKAKEEKKEVVKKESSPKKSTEQDISDIFKLAEDRMYSKKISESKLGKKRSPFSNDWIEKMSSSKQGEKNNMFGKNHTDETKQKQREKATGRKQSPETVAKKAEAVRGLKREKKLCPHCDQQIAVNGYARFHGDRCRHRSQP
jgi:hypothetical protein